MGSEAPPRRSDRVTVDGHTFWESKRDGRRAEVITHDDLALEAERSTWVVTPLTGVPAGPPIESDSPVVNRFLRRVVAEKERVSTPPRRPRPPVPKPRRKAMPVLPAHAPVPCPLCRPGADGIHAGEAWPDCEVCDGAGYVTQRRATEWRETHGG